MSQPDQWRFQWPDGTWIRWNPHTQTWEKEPPGAEGAADTREREPEALLPDPTSPPEDYRSLPEPELIDPEAESAETEPPDADDETEDVEPPRIERPADESVPRRNPRPMVDNVLPPESAAEQPAASLWPTVLTGIIVGLGVGLFLWNMIR